MATAGRGPFKTFEFWGLVVGLVVWLSYRAIRYAVRGEGSAVEKQHRSDRDHHHYRVSYCWVPDEACATVATGKTTATGTSAGASNCLAHIGTTNQ
jgi:hypothetical protein